MTEERKEKVFKIGFNDLDYIVNVLISLPYVTVKSYNIENALMKLKSLKLIEDDAKEEIVNN